jgi:hypothetical protein
VFIAGGLGHAAVVNSTISIARPSRITPLFATGDHAVHAAPTTVTRLRVGLDQLPAVGANTSFTRFSIGWDGASAQVTRSGVDNAVSRRTFSFMVELL